jgi:hypothetical protein
MITEALTVIPLLLTAPPTSLVGEPILRSAVFVNEAELPTSGQRPYETNISLIGQPTAFTFIRLEMQSDPLSKKDAAYRKLVGEIVNYLTPGIDEVNEEGEWDRGATIEHALSFLEALPVGIPLPKPMFLSRQVAIYWDFGEVYAEIDFDASGFIDAYGKRPGVPDVILDRLRIVDATGRVSFPTQLESIILPPEDAVIA